MQNRLIPLHCKLQLAIIIDPLPSALQLLLDIGERAIVAAPTEFCRAEVAELQPSRRLLIVRGSRGVGKTTLLQQYAQRAFTPERRAYFSLDDIVFTTIALVDAIHQLQAGGRDQIILDEVHRYPNWEQELKNCYDRYPGVRLLVTGSSMLQLQRGSADLSRRAFVLDLQGLSFRQFLSFSGTLNVDAIGVDQLLRDHETLHEELEERHGDLQPHFANYMRYGCFPGLAHAPQDAAGYLRSVVLQVIDRDIVPTLSLKAQTVRKLHLLFALIAESVPFAPTISKLAAQLGTSRELVVELLDALDRAGVIKRFWYGKGGDNRLSKPDKIYLANPAWCYAFQQTPNRGTLRETFFFSQLPATAELRLSKEGDFLLGADTFEIGGAGKGFSQIATLANGYLAVDSFERGRGHRIPLYLFGFVR